MMANRNRDAAVSFLKMASRGDVREAYSRFVSAGFRHHNPFCEGSAEALMAGMEENALQNPNKVLEVKRAIAEHVLRQLWEDETGVLSSQVLEEFYAALTSGASPTGMRS